jgi:hypothetical protein
MAISLTILLIEYGFTARFARDAKDAKFKNKKNLFFATFAPLR